MAQFTRTWTWIALVVNLKLVQGTEWYEHAILYQVKISTFKDGNGDGIGDILGLTQELKYIRSLGADAVILSPLEDLDSTTNSDEPNFDNFMKEANKIDLKVVVTLPRLVVSEFSYWFKNSTDRFPDRDDFLLWRGSMPSTIEIDSLTWLWSETRNKYYAMENESGQACLQTEHAEVRAEVAQLATSWLARGVAGLMLLPTCEPAPQLVRDLNMLASDYFRMHGGNKRVIIVDGTTSFAASREYMRSGSDAALVASSAMLGSAAARDLKYRIDRWLTYLPTRSTPLWMSGASVQGQRLVGIFSALALLLPGSAIIPQGSELGYGPNKLWPLDSLNMAANANLEFFLTLVQTRRTPTLELGGFDIKLLSDDVLAFVRFLEGKATFAVIMNLGEVNTEVDLSIFYGLDEVMSATRGRVRTRNAHVMSGEALLLAGGPRNCGGPGPVDKIAGKLSEAVEKISKYFNW